MTGAGPRGAPEASATPRPTPGGPHGHEGRDLWPHDFGRDGVSGLLTADRALRARDVSRPDAADDELAAAMIDRLLARVDGRRPARR